MKRTRRHRRAVAIGAGLVVAVLALDAGEARSQATFSGIAVADGIRATVSDPAVVPVGAELGLSGPSAQAVVDSLGTSRAYASLPYPGDLAVSAPGLARGSGATFVPDYPAYAASSSQGPKTADVAAPAGYTLHSASDDTSSAARATGGGAGEQANAAATRADASVKVASGVLTVAAESTTEAFEVAGVLRIGRVHAVSSARRQAGSSSPQLTSDLAVGDVTIAGQGVSLTPAGVTSPGGTTPLPDSSPLLSVLRQAGITVRYVAPDKTADGITSAGVDITVVHGTTRTTYSLGRVMATASGAPEPGEGALPASDSLGGATASDAANALALASPSPTSGAGAALDAPTGSTRGVRSPARTVRAAFRPTAVDRFSTSSLYLVLVLSALLCAAGTQLIRALGVKFSWDS